MFNLLYSNLQNPHDNFVSHLKSFPNIYPKDECPLCKQPRADLKHIFCSCSKIAADRSRALTSTTQEVIKAYASQAASLDIRSWLHDTCIPEAESHSTFSHGIISRDDFLSFESITNNIFSFANHGPSKIQSITFLRLYYPIWNAYNNKLLKTRNSFAQRLRSSYNITPTEKHTRSNSGDHDNSNRPL